MAAPTPAYSPDELSELLTAHMPDIPGYRVIRRIGQGGMSYVYLGVQESLDRQVAIKIIAPSALKDEVSKLRFEKEARTIAKLQHPCIVNIYEVGRTELGLLYYVMPYLPRGHLGERKLQDNEPALISILRSLLWALDYAHGRGVVHRDIKAENVLFDNVDRPLLTDFGIAINRTDRQRMTGGGFVLGSSSHMAPEQARGEKVDGRADLYSVGVLAYEMLCGEVPYKASDSLGLALMHAVDPIPRLPPAHAHWQPFIDKAMAKSAEERFAEAREMMAALEQIETARQLALNPPVTAPPGSGGLRMPAIPRNLMVGGALLCVLLAGTLLLWPAAPDPPASLATQTASAPAAAPLTAVPPATAIDQAAIPAAEADDADAAVSAAEEEVLLSPAEQALAAAARQIASRRLTQPAGDNALESLRVARRLLPDAPQLPPLGERWLAAVQPYIRDALADSGSDPDRRLFDLARGFADEFGLQRGSAWSGIEQVVTDWLRARLKAALDARDLPRVRAIREETPRWGIGGGALEPYWSQPIVTARRGDRLPGPGALLLVDLPRGEAAGLAVMSGVVSRGDYARFAAATSRASANCRIRTAVMTLRKRSWDKPGFEQTAVHPVVCVSLADAQAYALWRGEQDGQAYRLASEAEWRQWLEVEASAAACRDGRLACGADGTLAADAGPRTALGLHGAQGNVREWPADCRPGCTRQTVLGFGWRDATARSEGDAARLDPALGYDDVGFRLVREVPRGELELR